MSDLLDEVQQDLSEEKYYFYVRKIAKVFVSVAIIIILGVSIYVWKEHTTKKLQEKMSIWFNYGIAATHENKLDEAIVYFDNIINYPHQQYAALAYLNKAYVLFKQNKNAEGQETLLEMSKHKHFKTAFRELAEFTYLSNKLNDVSDGNENAVDELDILAKENKAWRFSSLQLKALYQIKANKITEAKETLNKIIDDKQASKSITESASAILSVISRQ